MPATTGAQAIAVTPATSISKDDSRIMTGCNSRNTSKSRNESNNRTANSVWTPAKAGTLAKVKKPAKACREANHIRYNIYIRDESSRDYWNTMDVARISRKVSSSREDSNKQQER